MKKIIYTISALSLIFLWSCEVEDGDYNKNRTLQGKFAFDQVKSYTDGIIHLAEMTSRASLYMQTAPEEKEAVAKFYFADYTVTEAKDEKTITLTSTASKWVFTHNGKSINEAEALWSLQASQKMKKNNEFVDVVPQNFFAIESLGDKNWELHSISLPTNIDRMLIHNYLLDDYMWNVSTINKQSGKVKVKATATASQAPNVYNYTIQSGNGYILRQLEKDKLEMSYVYTSPTAYKSDISNPLRMTKGTMNIQVSSLPDNKELIGAKLIDKTIEITMGDVTELYDDYYNYGYWYW